MATTLTIVQEDTSIGSVLHSALLLLAYKSPVYEVDISPGMFDKANTKGMEALLHFLLTKLRGASQAKKASLVEWSATAPAHNQVATQYQLKPAGF